MTSGYQSLEIHVLMKSLYKRMKQEWDIRVAEDKLSITQFRMLYHLNLVGPQKVAALAEALDVTPGAITGVADKLFERGLVDRERGGDDRRVVFLRVTDQGKSVIETLLEKNKETVSAFFKHLPDEDVEHLKRILSDVLNHVDLLEKEQDN
ncbi:MarR family winged helix-turn-helix transcriptional regulator [Paenibacillus sp. MBLB4367]|uniref:MarR family winged helix-turn-helix transcriptional regulator n=1 Tax=Paenibacillus sp. MBLB4367 TaxID=3384767 RepID=UPI003907EAE7